MREQTAKTIMDSYDALDCLHWLVDVIEPEAWDKLPEPLTERINKLIMECR